MTIKLLLFLAILTLAPEPRDARDLHVSTTCANKGAICNPKKSICCSGLVCNTNPDFTKYTCAGAVSKDPSAPREVLVSHSGSCDDSATVQFKAPKTSLKPISSYDVSCYADGAVTMDETLTCDGSPNPCKKYPGNMTVTMEPLEFGKLYHCDVTAKVGYSSSTSTTTGLQLPIGEASVCRNSNNPPEVAEIEGQFTVPLKDQCLAILSADADAFDPIVMSMCNDQKDRLLYLLNDLLDPDLPSTAVKCSGVASCFVSQGGRRLLTDDNSLNVITVSTVEFTGSDPTAVTTATTTFTDELETAPEDVFSPLPTDYPAEPNTLPTTTSTSTATVSTITVTTAPVTDEPFQRRVSWVANAGDTPTLDFLVACRTVPENNVYYRELLVSGTATSAVIGTASSSSDINYRLEPLQTYACTVQARNSAGLGTESAASPPFYTACPTLSKPVGTNGFYTPVTDEPRQISLSWSAPSDPFGESKCGAIDYRVECSNTETTPDKSVVFTGDSSTTIIVGTGTPAANAPLVPTTSYNCKVAGINGAGIGAYFDPSTPFTVPCPVPTAGPATVTVEAIANEYLQKKVYWDAVTAPHVNCPITSYAVVCSASDADYTRSITVNEDVANQESFTNRWAVIGNASPNAANNPMVAGESYKCKVTASNAGGASESYTESSSFGINTPPTAATDVLTAGFTPTTWSATWTASNCGVSDTGCKYNLKCIPKVGDTAITCTDTGVVSTDITAPATSGTVKGLDFNKAYKCFVLVSNAAFTSPVCSGTAVDVTTTLETPGCSDTPQVGYTDGWLGGGDTAPRQPVAASTNNEKWVVQTAGFYPVSTAYWTGTKRQPNPVMVNSTVAHSGSRSVQLHQCMRNCGSQGFVGYPGIDYDGTVCTENGEGGGFRYFAGESGTGASANRARVSVWIKSATSPPSPSSDPAAGAGGDRYVSFSLGGWKSQRMTFMAMGNFGVNNEMKMMVSTNKVVNGASVSTTQYSPALDASKWYKLVQTAYFINGPSNDEVVYQLFDDTNTEIWSSVLQSWEEPYYAGGISGYNKICPNQNTGPSVAGTIIPARRLIMRNVAPSDTANLFFGGSYRSTTNPGGTSTIIYWDYFVKDSGYYIDDVEIATWKDNDATKKYCYSTGFETT